MKVIAENNNIILRDTTNFSLEQTFGCGQCFRFDASADGEYTGTAGGRTLTIAERGTDIVLYDVSLEEYETIWRDYFDLCRDYGDIARTLTASGDPVTEAAVRYGSGIRILRQDAWETLISFIISASNNIPRIKKIIRLLAVNFGEAHDYRAGIHYSFPTPERLASLAPDELDVVRAGFRAKYIHACARLVAEGRMRLDDLAALPTTEARKALMALPGVGNKVADCILLFAYSRFDVFPVDVWIKRVIEYFYFDGERQPIKDIAAFAKERFGALGGIAQQYLFYYARERKLGK